MNSILYIGMDIHKESYTLCYYSFGDDELRYKQTVEPDYKMILKYLERVRNYYPEGVDFICGYEAENLTQAREARNFRNLKIEYHTQLFSPKGKHLIFARQERILNKGIHYLPVDFMQT